jgi:diadenosine tetraphosphatase ApaH/serine/threonine PP2A family protein phosphatase
VTPLKEIALIGDVHSNFPALRAVIDAAGSLDSFWCVGDIVGYGPHPNECVETIRDISAQSVAGNHDLGSIGAIDLLSFNADAGAVCEWTGTRLSDESRAYLSSLPHRKGLQGEQLLVHGSPRNPVWEYVLSTNCAFDNFSMFKERICINGHSHVPAVFGIKEGDTGNEAQTVELEVPKDGGRVSLMEDYRYMVNVGSVGQPRDGDPRSCFVIYRPEERSLTFHRVAYPVVDTQADMERFGLPRFLADRLSAGR